MKFKNRSNTSARPDSSDQFSNKSSRSQLICSRCFNAVPTHVLDCGHLGKFSDIDHIVHPTFGLYKPDFLSIVRVQTCTLMYIYLH